MTPHDPNGIIRLLLAGTAAQWQAFVDFCDAQGIHRIVRPFIDQILQQANAPQQVPPDAGVGTPAPEADTKGAKPRTKPTAIPETTAAE